MVYHNQHKMLALTLIILCLNASGQDIVYTSPEAFTLQDVLLEWSDSLKSFSGTYTMNQYWFGFPGRDPNTPNETGICYRFEGKNRYMDYSDTLKNPKKEEPVKIHFHISLYDGVISRREDFGKTKKKDKYSIANVGRDNEWPIPEGAYLTPDRIFQGERSPSLKDYLSKGESGALFRNGQWVLTHRFPDTSPERLDVWFDEKKRPKTFNFGYCVDAPPEEIKRMHSGDLFELFDLSTSIELDKFVEINGVWFPTWARKTWWQYENSKVPPDIEDAFQTKKISRAEYQLKRTLALGKRYWDTYQDCVFDPQRISINTPLSKADFAIDIPVGTLVHSKGDNRLFPYLGPWYVRIFNRWTGLAALFLVGCGLTILVIRSRKHI